MRTIEKTVYSFSELSEPAKDKAREWFRSCDDNWYAEDVIDDSATIADIIGIDLRQTRKARIDNSHFYAPTIFYSGFSSQGDGASFEGKYTYKKGALKALRQHIGSESKGDKELIRIATELQNIQKRYFYKLAASMRHTGLYMHSGCMSVDVTHQDDEYRDIGNAESDIRQCMRDFADWIYAQLEREYDYQNSDSTVDENIEENEYEFTENGGRV
jgi:hypothetical protein